MKKILFLALILSLSALCSLLGQTTKKSLNYQAVILDPKAIDIPGASLSGQPLSKGKVCLKFTFVNAQGNVDYEETQQTTTDEYGLVSISVGTGTYNAGTYRSFESIVWDANVKSMKVAVSYDGCNSFKQVSTQALNYTPYALYAEAVDYKNVKDAPTKLSQFSNDAGYLILKDLDPIKADIKKNTEDIKTNTADIKTNTADIKTNTADINTNAGQIASANQTIAENKKASDDSFLIVKQSISDLGIKVISNTNSIVTIEGKINEQQNLINDTRNQLNSTTSSINGQINGLQNQVNTTANTVNTLIGDAQIVANKSTASNLGGASPSDILYPSQKAAKTYVDNAIYNAVGTGVADATTLAPGKVQLAGDLAGTATAPTVPGLANKENLSNKSTATSLGTSNDLYPTQNAVKVYVDQATQGIALQAAVDAKADKNSPVFTGTPNLPTGTIAVTQNGADNSTKIATTAFVQAATAAGIIDASSTTKGKLKLAGDLGGTAESPTVPGLALKANSADVNTALALKEDASNKSTATALGTSDALYPSQKAVKTYVDAQIASATIADADPSTKGKIQLAGDLGGTASSPTVPGLALKANSADVNSSLALKAPINNPTFTGTVGGITNSMVGLGNVDNTSDANKPVSTATQTALDLKAPLASPTFTGTPSLPTGTTGVTQSTGDNSTKLATTEFVTTKLASGAPDATTTATGKIQLAGDLGGTAALPTVPGLALKANSSDVTNSLALKAPINNPTFTGTVGGITNSMVGLGNVDNTSDANKPVSTATQTALDLKAPLASPTFTGTPSLPTGTTAITQSAGDNSTKLATTEFVTTKLASGAPDATTTATGKVQLAGDLGGTASAPTVPGLALKANTTDVNSSLALKAPINNPTFTGTVGGITNSMVGLGNVDNTSDANKPVSTATQTALDLKAPLASPTFTGTPSLPTGTTAITQSAGDNSTKLATTEFVTTKLASGAPDATTTATGKVQLAGDLGGTASSPTVPGLALKANTTDVNSSLALKAPINNPTFTGTVGGITNSMVGLGNVDNTSDANKPVSTATQTALDLKAPINNPTFTGTVGGITNSMVGLGNVDNTSDANKPVSTATQTALDLKSPLASPTFTGDAKAVTATAGDNDVSIATTEFVTSAVTTATPTNYVTTNTAQTITSAKTFSETTTFSKDAIVNGLTVGKGGGNKEFNTAIGVNALPVNTTGNTNTATGVYALYKNTTGSSNTASGTTALFNNTTGLENSAFGQGSLFYNTTGSYNAAYGRSSLFNNSTGSYNTVFGHSAFLSNTTGSNNTAIGYGADVASNNLTNATAIGYGAVALGNNTIQLGNTAVTDVKTSGTLTAGTVTYPNAHNGENGQVLTINSTGTASWAAAAGGGVPYTGATGAVNLGAYDLTVNGITVGKGGGNVIRNTATGIGALVGNTTGSNNTASGYQALNSNTEGADNTASGYRALRFNTTGSNNTASGSLALNANTSGGFNTAFGLSSLQNNATGSNNTASGVNTLYSNTIGDSNTASGDNALYSNTTGSNNTAYGNGAGRYIANGTTSNTTSDFSVYLGSNTKASADDAQNEVVIGYNAIGAGSNTIQLGNTAVTDVKTSGTVTASGTVLTSDLRLKSNISPLASSLATVMQLNPVHYMKKSSLASTAYTREENGFIAQEIQKILPFIVKEGTDENKLLSVDYNSFIPMLTKAIQEQQKQIEDQNSKIAAQQKQIEELIKLVKGQ
jgi:trimeric autotransporter adhesin